MRWGMLSLIASGHRDVDFAHDRPAFFVYREQLFDPLLGRIEPRLRGARESHALFEQV